MDKRKIRECIGLLNSMVECGEKHTVKSYEIVANALTELGDSKKETVLDRIRTYELMKMAIYLHSFQAEQYTVEEIRDLLQVDASVYDGR